MSAFVRKRTGHQDISSVKRCASISAQDYLVDQHKWLPSRKSSDSLRISTPISICRPAQYCSGTRPSREGGCAMSYRWMSIAATILAACSTPSKDVPPSEAAGCPSERFVLRGDQVLDVQTHLTWRRCPLGPIFDSSVGSC